MIRSTAGSHFTSASSSHPAIWSGSLHCCQNITPWAAIYLQEQETITGNEFQWVGRVGDDCHLRRSPKLPQQATPERQSVVMMQGPGVVAPLVWSFAPDVFCQASQNAAVEFSIHSLSWWNKFLMHDTFIVKLLPHFRLWFELRVVRNTLHHQLISIHSWNA